MQSVGFIPIGPEWTSCYYHLTFSLMLSIYVDDFKMGGLRADLPSGWKLLRHGLQLAEQRIDDKGSVYLGCRHVVSPSKLPHGVMATTMAYAMQDILKTCIARYLEVAGPNVTLRGCSTPILNEDHWESPAGGPGVGPVRECPWCFYTGPPASFCSVIIGRQTSCSAKGEGGKVCHFVRSWGAGGQG